MIFKNISIRRADVIRQKSEAVRHLASQLIEEHEDYARYKTAKPVFLNVYRVRESIPRNEFCQPMIAWRAGTIILFLLGS